MQLLTTFKTVVILCYVDAVMQVVHTSINFAAAIVITIEQSPVTFSNCITRSRSIIVNLAAGDTLYVITPSGCFFADGNRMQFFSGMKLF